jgi:putative hydrolase of the HAD superfamily
VDEIRAVSFDLDDTLSYVDDAAGIVDAVCIEVASRLPNLQPETLRAANAAVWQDFWPTVEDDWALGRFDTDAVGLEAWRRSLLACDCDDELIVRLARDMHAGLGRKAYRLFDDVLPLLDVLAGRVQLALITNSEALMQREKLRILELEHHFDVIVISAELGAAKPDATVFSHVLDRLSVTPGQTWHVGDSLKNDVAGALNAGLTAVWLNRWGRRRQDNDPAPHHEVCSLAELPSLMGLEIGLNL